MPQQHPYELVAADTAAWVDKMSAQLADSMRYGGRAPFAAPASEADKLQYYEDQLFNPDGSPNAQARTDLIQRVGTQKWAATLGAVMKARSDRMQAGAGEIQPGQMGGG